MEQITSNYRPVSNLSFFSKVLEKAALAQFNEHCAKNDFMPDYQSAYRAGYSCETALVKLMSDLLWNMEHQKVTALMAIDLSTAFDTVDHDILLDVLQKNFVLDGPVKSCLGYVLKQHIPLTDLWISQNHRAPAQALCYTWPMPVQ